MAVLFWVDGALSLPYTPTTEMLSAVIFFFKYDRAPNDAAQPIKNLSKHQWKVSCAFDETLAGVVSFSISDCKHHWEQ